MGKTITICFTNNKGGSGKSTTCSNLGAAIAQTGKKVLLVDGDMQLNLSLAFFSEDWVLEHAAGEKNLYYGIKKQEDLTDYVVHTPYENLDLIPSSTLMSSIEYELFTKWQREFILRKCLQKIKESGMYDYILIDTCPSLGTLTINALAAADEVIITVNPQLLAMMGMQDFIKTVMKIRRRINPNLGIAGILLTMCESRTKLCKVLTEQVTENFQEQIHIFETRIPNTVKVGESIYYSMPIEQYSPKANAGIAYRKFAKELIANES